MLLRITARHFVAGIVASDFVIVEAAPIVKYMRGWRTKQVWLYCQRKGWRVECLTH